MAISTLHHVIPDMPPPHPQPHIPVERTPLTTTFTATSGKAGTTATTSLMQNASSALGLVAWATLILIIILIFFIAVLVVKPSPTLLGSIREGPGQAPGEAALYKYRGLRKRLRQLFLAVRAKAESKVGAPLRSKTAAEIARVTGMYREFAREYTRAMYGPASPDEHTVSRIERLARDEA